MTTLKAPFPYFGGKSRVAPEVWRRFGDVRNYVEPFFGSGACLLARPQPFVGVETVNDKDGFVANFWRAVQADPAAVALHADWPVNENDLHARHAFLTGLAGPLTSRLEGNPDYYDTKLAGWWVWGLCCWLGGGFCNGKGPWKVTDVAGESHLVRETAKGLVTRRIPSISRQGHGTPGGLIHWGIKCGRWRELIPAEELHKAKQYYSEREAAHV